MNNIPHDHQAISASANALTFGVEAIYIGGSGNVTATMNGNSVTYAAIAGTYILGTFSHVTAATATGLVGVKF